MIKVKIDGLAVSKYVMSQDLQAVQALIFAYYLE